MLTDQQLKDELEYDVQDFICIDKDLKIGSDGQKSYGFSVEFKANLGGNESLMTDFEIEKVKVSEYSIYKRANMSHYGGQPTYQPDVIVEKLDQIFDSDFKIVR